MCWGAKAHDPLHAGAIVPGTVEEDDLAGGGQMTDIALEIPFAALALGGFGQGDGAGVPRVEMTGEAADGAALAGGVASLENDDETLIVCTHPFLQLHQLQLQPAQLFAIGPFGNGRVIGIARPVRKGQARDVLRQGFKIQRPEMVRNVLCHGGIWPVFAAWMRPHDRFSF